MYKYIGLVFLKPHKLKLHLIALKILDWVQNERVGASLSLEHVPPFALMCYFVGIDEVKRCSCIKCHGRIS
jgi:hypothetical protein